MTIRSAFRQATWQRLFQPMACGKAERPLFRPGTDRVHSCRADARQLQDRFGLHHHPVAPAKRAVVGHLVLIHGKLASVVDIDLHNTGQFSPADYSKIKDLPEKLGENC